MQLTDFHYDLPSTLIAGYPLAGRSTSRLMILSQSSQTVSHHIFSELVELVQPGDLLVFNDTRVIPARLRGLKSTGGKVEVLVERILNNNEMLAQIRTSKPLQPGSLVQLDDNNFLEMRAKKPPFYQLHYDGVHNSILTLLETLGEIPLPPYLHRAPDAQDNARYQTIYARHKGSVAAPTAGLHFDQQLFTALQEKQVEIGYLTLHIGAGTFAPVRVDDIRTHKMHAEYLDISAELCRQIIAAKTLGKRIIAVGTTCLRALETASQGNMIAPYRGETSIFIYPGYEFRCADVLVTNFHLPCSTLLMLVCAFGGYEKVMQAYNQAVQHAYRFYSYGDAMWVERN